MSLTIDTALNFGFASTQAGSTVSVAQALATLRTNPRAKISINDTADQIERNFDALARWNGNISAVSVSDLAQNSAGWVDINATQFKKNAKFIAKFTDSDVFSVSQATAQNATSLDTNAKVANFTVRDNSAEIGSRLSTLSALTKLSKLTVSTPETSIGMSAADLETYSDLLAKVQGGPYGLKISQATVDAALALKDNTRVRSIAIVDSASAISDGLDDLVALGSKLQGIRSNDSSVIQVNAGQMQTDALVIGKIYKGHELAIRQSTLAQAIPLASNRKVTSIEVVDTAANISNYMPSLARLGNDLTSIHITDTNNLLKISSAAYQAYSGVLSKILTDDDYGIEITDASVHEAQTLASQDKVQKINVADSSTMISANLADLASNDKVMQIVTTGKSRTIAVAASQLADNGALAKINGDYLLSVLNVSANDAKSLVESEARIASLTVSGSGADVVSKIGDLAWLGKKLTSIDLSDGDTALDLDAATWNKHMGTLAKIKDGYAVNVTQVGVGQALRIAKDARVSTLSISDRSDAISYQLDALHQLGNRLTRIEQTDAGTPLSVTGLQYTTQSSTLAKLGNDLVLSVKKASASQAGALAADDRVAQVSVEDTSSNISSAFDNLQTAASGGTQTWSIRTVNDPQPIRLTASQYLDKTAALSALTGRFRLSVTGATVDDIATLLADNKVATVSVSDASDSLKNHLNDLTSLGDRLTSVTQTDAQAVIELTASDWTLYQNTLRKWSDNVKVNLTAVQAGNAQRLVQDWRIKTLSILDSRSEIGRNLDVLQTIATQVQAVRTTSAGNVNVTVTQLDANAAILSKFDPQMGLTVTNASAAEAAVLASDGHDQVTLIDVQDTGAQIAGKLSDLSNNEKLRHIQLTDANLMMNLTAAQWTDQSAVLAKIKDPYQLQVSDANLSMLNGLLADAHVRKISVQDTAAELVSKLTNLKNAGDRISSVSIDGATTLTMTQTQWSTHQSVLAKINQNHSIVVNQVTASQAAQVGASLRVATVHVSDTGAQVARNLDALQMLGSKLGSITTTDVGDAPILNLNINQLNTDAQALAKITDGRYRLNIAEASVNDFLALQSNSKLANISIADTSSNVAINLSALAGSSALSAIALSAPSEPMEMSASDYSQYNGTLSKISTGYAVVLSGASVAAAGTLQTDSKVQGMTISDTSAHISSSLAALSAMSKITGFDVTQDNGTIQFSLTQLDTLPDTLSLLNQATGVSHRIEVTGASVNDLDELLARDDVDLVRVNDSSANIASGYDRLYAAMDRISGIQLSDATEPVNLSQQQLLNQPELLQKISGSPALQIYHVSATNASAISNTSGVTGVQVLDTASAISQEFDNLVSLGSKVLEVQVSDDNDILISSAQATDGASLLDRIVGEHSVVIT